MVGVELLEWMSFLLNHRRIISIMKTVKDKLNDLLDLRRRQRELMSEIRNREESLNGNKELPKHYRKPTTDDLKVGKVLWISGDMLKYNLDESDSELHMIIDEIIEDSPNFFYSNGSSYDLLEEGDFVVETDECGIDIDYGKVAMYEFLEDPKNATFVGYTSQTEVVKMELKINAPDNRHWKSHKRFLMKITHRWRDGAWKECDEHRHYSATFEWLKSSHRITIVNTNI